MMAIEHLMRKPVPWVPQRQASQIVISSRVRLARNLKGERFPGWAGEEARARVGAFLGDALRTAPGLTGSMFVDMGALSVAEKQILTERHLISHELAERGIGSGLVVSADEQVAVMVNEEDHLRLQAILPGLDLIAAWERIDAVDSDLERRVEYAFSPRLGYLTACPTNLGTGLRASVMMHLSGLRLLEEIEPAINGLERIGLTVRGLTGEGTEAHGNMFQISNQMTIGESEDALVRRLCHVVGEVEGHERRARQRLLEGKRTYLLDQVGRALGVLLHARVMPSREAIELLSGVKLGVETGLVRNLDVNRVNELMLLTQPGHLQRISGEELTTEERDELRAQVIGEGLHGAKLAN